MNEAKIFSQVFPLDFRFDNFAVFNLFDISEFLCQKIPSNMPVSI